MEAKALKKTQQNINVWEEELSNDTWKERSETGRNQERTAFETKGDESFKKKF